MKTKQADKGKEPKKKEADTPSTPIIVMEPASSQPQGVVIEFTSKTAGREAGTKETFYDETQGLQFVAAGKAEVVGKPTKIQSKALKVLRDKMVRSGAVVTK